MGYTHYWAVKEPFELQDSEVAELKSYYAENFDIRIRYEWDSSEPPIVQPQYIRFNGVGDEGHETFLVDLAANDQSFCKTRRKPYDFLVAVTLLVLRNGHPDSFTFCSDGGLEDEGWQQAVSYLVGKGYDQEILESYLKD